MRKVAAGATTHYLWEGNRVMAEYNGSASALLVKYVLAGSRLIAEN